MLAAMPADKKGDADRQGCALAHSRCAGGLCVARHRRSTHLRRRQRRNPLRARRQDRRARVGTESRDDSEVVAGARRRQAVRRARRTASSTSSARSPTAPRSSTKTGWGASKTPEPIIAAPAVARGRVYVVSMNAIYAIGPKMAPSGAPANPVASTAKPAASLPAGVPAAVLVTPTELILKPGESIALTAKAFDANGAAVALPGPATWTLENIKGTVTDGKFTADAAAGAQAGVVKAALGTIVGASAHPRHSGSALELRLRGWECGSAAAMGKRDRQVRGPGSRWQQGARQAGGKRLRIRQAVPAVLRLNRPDQLHD